MTLLFQWVSRAAGHKVENQRQNQSKRSTRRVGAQQATTVQTTTRSLPARHAQQRSNSCRLRRSKRNWRKMRFCPSAPMTSSVRPHNTYLGEFVGKLFSTGFPRRLETLENENGHGKVMKHEKLDKRHGILWSVMEFYQFCPWIVPNLYLFGHH